MTTARTAELFHRGTGVLLDLGADTDPASGGLADVTRDGHRVVRVSARPAPGSPLRTGEALLVRPDGYVAWAGRSTADPALHTALRRWFGEPDRARTAPHQSTATAAAR